MFPSILAKQLQKGIGDYRYKGNDTGPHLPWLPTGKDWKRREQYLP